MLGGFHFNDRRYADDDLTIGSIDPYQVFRIFHEIRYFEWETGKQADIAYMVDQSHNLKGKIEAMIQTVTMAQQLFSKAALVDGRRACDRAEELRPGARRILVAGRFRHRRPPGNPGMARVEGTAQRSHGGISRRADTSSASPKNAPPEIHETSPPMPEACHARPYLAFDFGAESGRAVLARLQSGVLTTEEVHRFPNEPVEYGGSLHWDVPRLWFEVRKDSRRSWRSGTGGHRRRRLGCGLCPARRAGRVACKILTTTAIGEPKA